MAECTDWRYSYFWAKMEAWESGTGSNYSNVHWKVTLRYSQLRVAASTWHIYVNDQSYDCTLGSISEYSSGEHYAVVGEGDTTVWHTDAVTIGFGFSMGNSWNISGTWTGGLSANGALALSQLAVAPTAPNSVNVTGFPYGNQIVLSNPKINVSWSGATAGTYTIQTYCVDISKDNFNNWANVGTLYTSGTSGTINNIDCSALGISGGTNFRVRVTMLTSRGDWLAAYWGGTVTVVSPPSAPSWFSVPSSQEIDTGFNISWGGASGGTNGIAGYDLEIRAYNPQNGQWTGWTRLWNCVNLTSYASGSPKSLSVSGVSYSGQGENVQFQYRLRTSDGRLAVSEWLTRSMTIKINSPTVPRK